jgi:uncharacterized membrane protein
MDRRTPSEPVRVSYNAIAGGSLERLSALSDGIFAVAMTLLVLDVKPPEALEIHDGRELAAALVHLAPRVLMFAMSFLTLGIFWTGQQTQLTQLARGDRNLGWLHLVFLFAVSMMPFSTMLLAQFIAFQPALGVYWANILALGVMLFVSWRYAMRAQLVKREVPHAARCAIERRIVAAQLLYAVGALLSFIHPYVSIGFIVALQLYFAIAPRLRG